MPIFEIVFSRPLAIPLIARVCASSGGHPVRQPAAVDELAERLEHQVRVDRGGAVADQRRDAVDAARLARLDDEPGLQARALAHEVVVHGRDREQRRDRRALRRRRRGRRGSRMFDAAPRARASASRAEPLERALQSRRRPRRPAR